MGMGSAHAMEASGHLHADARIRHGFKPAQLLAEFRALRASVLRLYEESGATDLADVRRFNEAIDEALTESMTRYTAMTDRYRDQFIGILGHDRRNPLNSIASGATLLTIRADADSTTANVASGMLRSAHRMGRLINDLLDLTQARLGGEIPVKREQTELGQLCQEVVLEAQGCPPGRHRRVHNSSGDLRGEWDRDRLAQMLSISRGERHLSTARECRHVESAAGLDRRCRADRSHNGGVPIPPELQHAIHFSCSLRHTAGLGVGDHE